MDVVVVAARRDMISAVLEAVRSAGLRPGGIDLSAFGMIRALYREQELAAAPSRSPTRPPDAGAAGRAGSAASASSSPCGCSATSATSPTSRSPAGPCCEFTRISGFGVEGIAQRLAEKRGLTLEHARQWLGHVGLEQPLENIDGDPEIVERAREVLGEGAAKLADELRLSLEFYSAQEGAGAIESVVACGPGSRFPA